MMLTYLINLKRRKDRLERISKRWPFKWPLFRFNAIETMDVNGFPNVGYHGCTLSHLKVIQGAIKLNLDHVMILEDDCIFRDDAEQIVSDAMKQLPKNWHVLYLGCTGETKPFSKSLAIPIEPIHTHAYILSRAGMRWLAARITDLLSLSGSKLCFDCYVKNDEVPRFRTNPTCAIQEDGFSDIANTSSEKMYRYFSGRDTMEKFVAHCEELNHGRRITSDSGST